MPRRTASSPIALAAALLASACAGSPGGASSSTGGVMPGFDPGPVPAGYVRYLTPVIHGIAAGSDTMWCQWLTTPITQAEDVLAVSGAESKLGHHVVLYATTDSQPVGTTRLCTSDDMLSLRFLGFVGGEGGSTSAGTIPPGVAFHVPAGMALMANVHFINATASAIDGQAAIDVQTAPPSPDRREATLFANTTLKLAIQPRQTASADVRCAVTRDLPFLMASAHMHANGVSAFTEVIHADGSREDLTRTQGWTSEQQFNPTWTKWSVEAPFVVHAGETLHTQCTWNNAGTTELTFPSEMCAGVGFVLSSGPEVQCVDGAWTE